MSATIVLFLISFATLSGIHFLATELLLYWRVWWIDLVVHVFGGAIVVLGLASMIDLRCIPQRLLGSLGAVLLIVLLVAVSWEVFWKIMEWYGLAVPKENYWLDTSTDIVAGLVGAIIGYGVITRLRRIL